MTHASNDPIIREIPSHGSIKSLMILPGQLDPTTKPSSKCLQYTLHVHLNPIYTRRRQITMQLVVKLVHTLWVHQTQSLYRHHICLPRRIILHHSLCRRWIFHHRPIFLHLLHTWADPTPVPSNRMPRVRINVLLIYILPFWVNILFLIFIW